MDSALLVPLLATKKVEVIPGHNKKGIEFLEIKNWSDKVFLSSSLFYSINLV